MTSWRAKGATCDLDIDTNIGNMKMNRGKTPVRVKYMDRCSFEEAKLSNPGKEHTLKSGGSEGENTPRVGK